MKGNDQDRAPTSSRLPTAAGGVVEACARAPTVTLSSCRREQLRKDGPGSLSDRHLKHAVDGYGECILQFLEAPKPVFILPLRAALAVCDGGKDGTGRAIIGAV
eukprot:scaffold8378_cov54-Phaeocystis_antarctica.AAC.2